MAGRGPRQGHPTLGAQPGSSRPSGSPGLQRQLSHPGHEGQTPIIHKTLGQTPNNPQNLGPVQSVLPQLCFCLKGKKPRSHKPRAFRGKPCRSAGHWGQWQLLLCQARSNPAGIVSLFASLHPVTPFLIRPPKERAGTGMGGFQELLQGDLKANCKSFLNCKGREKKGKKPTHKKPTQQNLVYLSNKIGMQGSKRIKKSDLGNTLWPHTDPDNTQCPLAWKVTC